MKQLHPGDVVVWDERKWTLVDIPSVDRVLLRNSDGEVELVPAAQIKSASGQGNSRQGLMAIPKEDWDEAAKRLKALRPLLDRPKRNRNQAEVDVVARIVEKDRATVYRWIKKWEEARTVSSLLRVERSDAGETRLAEEVEEAIQRWIKDYWLTQERPSVTELHERIEIECREKRLPVPSLSTIRRRVEQLSDKLKMAMRQGKKKASEVFEPLRGSFPGADFPRAVYQIDHTPIDLILVDEEYRESIGRAWLTIVTDVCTRMLAGFYVSLDPTGALATGLALTHAILPKDAWMAEKELDGKWPIWGMPAKIFADNAKEFRGKMLGRASSEHNIILENRPKGLPKFGGHVERLFRTFLKRTQSLPGTTFSNSQDKGDYDSAQRAALTLKDYEKWFSIFVTQVYHNRPHKGIGRRVPLKVYEQFVLGSDTVMSIGLPEPIRDEAKLRMDFMPYEERTIQEYGVLIDHIEYYADVLRPWIHARDPNQPRLKRKFMFARDPRDISTIYFFDPDLKAYFPIPYKNTSRPSISLWELNAALERLKQTPERVVDEDAIFEGLIAMRQLVDEARGKTAAVRRQKQRREDWKGTTKKSGGKKPAAPQSPSSPSQDDGDDDDWGVDIKPFDNIEVSK